MNPPTKKRALSYALNSSISDSFAPASLPFSFRCGGPLSREGVFRGSFPSNFFGYIANFYKHLSAPSSAVTSFKFLGRNERNRRGIQGVGQVGQEIGRFVQGSNKHV